MSNGQGEETKDVKITMQDVPSPPEDVQIKDVFQSSCVVKWTPPKDDGGAPIVKYLVERQDLGKKSGWDVVSEVPGDAKREVKLEDLVPKRIYKFRVRAVNKIGPGEPATFAQQVLAKDPWDEPGKPKNVDVVDWDVDHADLTWEKPDNDGGAPIEGYVVEFKDKFGKEWKKGPRVPADARAATVPNLTENQQYEFRVRAINRAGPGEPSDVTKPIIAKCRFVKPFIIGDELKPIIVKKGQVVKYDVKYGGEPEPEVKWMRDKVELFEDTEQRTTIDKYERNSVLTVRRTVRADSGLYKIILSNSSGTIESKAEVIVLDKPTQPKSIEATEVRATHAKVKWTKPADNGGTPITGYILEKMDTDTGRWVPAGEVDADQDEFTFKGLTKGKKYKFRVKAYNKEGEGEPIETFDSITAKNPYDEPGTPGKPDIIDYDNTSVTLKWAPPESDGGRPISHYTVELKSKFQVDWLEVAKTDDANPEIKVPDLKERMVYQFRVRAHNKAGASKPSEPTDNHLVKHKNREYFMSIFPIFVECQKPATFSLVEFKYKYNPCNSMLLATLFVIQICYSLDPCVLLYLSFNVPLSF